MELGTEQEKHNCEMQMRNVFQIICDLGLGAPILDSGTNSIIGVHKYSRQSLSGNAQKWLLTNRVSLSLFGPVKTTPPQQHTTPSLASLDHPQPSTDNYILPNFTGYEVKQSRNNNSKKKRTLDDRKKKEQKVLFADVVPGPLMDQATLKKHLQCRPEFGHNHIQIPYPRALKNMLTTRVICTEDAACDVEWDVTYFTARCGSIVTKTLKITQYSDHNHSSGDSNSGRVFSPQIMKIAESIVQVNSDKALSYLSFELQLKQKLHEKGIDCNQLPCDKRMKTWLKRAKVQKNKGKGGYIMQPSSQGLAESIIFQISERRKWFGDIADELVILPDNPRFTACLVSKERTIVMFCCKGMFDTLKRFCGERAHITVDTKMNVLKRQRGVVNVYLNVKDGLRFTTFHTKQGRVRGNALTTHDMPVLQAIINEESKLNHDDVFEALQYLWECAHPNGPPFRKVFRQISKDFAPGIEASRKERLSFMRPLDDFFHFMGKSSEMEGRCQEAKILDNGKTEKINLGWTKAILENIQNGATVDLLHEIWMGFLRKLCSKKEIVLAVYLYSQYSERLTVKDLQTMNIFPNNPNLTEILFFLSWSGGFAAFPGSNTGSAGGEAAHSPWQKELQQRGGKWEIEEALSFMQTLYTNRWQKMYDWNDSSKSYSLVSQVRDPQLLNGKLLGKLGRTTLFDFCKRAESEQIVHKIDMNDNFFVVMSRTADQPLASRETAELGCKILCSYGIQLRNLLLQSGILYVMDSEDQRTVGTTYLAERNRRKPHRLPELERFRESLGINEDGSCIQPLFSLSKFRELFHDMIYVIRDHPSGISDSWNFLRCTCSDFSKHAPCEHVEYARTLDIPGMQDTPNSSDHIPLPNKKGRTKGSFTIAKGKAKSAAKKKVKKDF